MGIVILFFVMATFWFLYYCSIKLFRHYLFKKEWKGIKLNRLDFFILSIVSIFPKKTIIKRQMGEGIEFPLTNEEIRILLTAIQQKYPLAVIGIEKIYIRKRPDNQRIGVRGSYFPNFHFLSGDIHLYAFPIDNQSNFLHGYTSEDRREAFFIPASKELTKFAAINTFLHEIAHHYWFNKTGELNGEHVEKFCDNYAMKLANELDVSSGIQELDKFIKNNY